MTSTSPSNSASSSRARDLFYSNIRSMNPSAELSRAIDRTEQREKSASRPTPERRQPK